MPSTRQTNRKTNRSPETGTKAVRLPNGVQIPSSSEASSNQGLQTSASTDRQTSGVVTRSKSQSRVLQQDQHLGKRKRKNKNNPLPNTTEASLNQGLQTSASQDKTTSGIVTRSSTRKPQTQSTQENPAQHPSKGKNNDNPPPATLWWFFYHQKAQIPHRLLLTQDMLDRSLEDLITVFASEICKRYKVNVHEKTIRFRIPLQAIKAEDIDSDWMKSIIAQFGPSDTDEFESRAKDALKLLSPAQKMRQVVGLVPKVDDEVDLVVTAEVIQIQHSNTAPQEKEEPGEPIQRDHFVLFTLIVGLTSTPLSEHNSRRQTHDLRCRQVRALYS